MTLFEFLDPNQPIRNQWVTHPGFRNLYVRKGRLIYFYEGDLRDKIHDVPNSIQLATVEATKPRHGAFTKLIKTLRENYPGQVIYIENLSTPNYFKEFIQRIGFKRTSNPDCFILD